MQATTIIACNQPGNSTERTRSVERTKSWRSGNRRPPRSRKPPTNGPPLDQLDTPHGAAPVSELAPIHVGPFHEVPNSENGGHRRLPSLSTGLCRFDASGP